jgi:hypothetical protein
MMQYRVVAEQSISKLESSVKFFFLEVGWECQGGVQCVNGYYLQAVIKKD